MSKNEYEDEDFLARPLSPAERRILRKMIENEARVQWFWGTVRVWAGWISAAIVGSWAIIEIVGKVWKRSL